MKKTYIYSLVCPLDGQVKYVGKANDTKGRFRKHKSLGDTNTGDNSDKNEWIKTLLDQGLLPILEILEEVDVPEWKVKEKFYVRQFKENGIKLFNICGGGNGATFGNSGSYKGNPPVKVVCLTKSGEYVNTFNSVKEGKEFSGKRIDNVLAGKRKTSGGYIWLYEKDYTIITKEELNIIVDNANTINTNMMGVGSRWEKGNTSWNKGKTGFISKQRKQVHQYTLDDNFMKTWECAKIAALELGCTTGNITMCACGITKTARGYKWLYNKL